MLTLTRPVLLLTIALGAVGATALATRPVLAGNNSAPARQGSSHTITVRGHGTVAVTPDQATVDLGVQTKADNARDAAAQNAQHMEAVIAAIQAQGIPSTDIRTSDVSLYYSGQGGSYVANNQVIVTINDVSRVGGVLDAAVAAGANNSWGVSFGLKDSSAAEAAALKNAVSNGRQRADAIAGTLGVTITGVSSASEGSYNVTPISPLPSASVAASGAPSTPIQSGQITVTADVTVVYTFG